jgi:subtilisin-like proprotein convertase family protein
MCPTIGQCNNNLTGWGALSTAEIIAKKNSAPCLSQLSPLGACCVGSTCTQASASECGTAGGTWSANTPCTTRTTYSASPNLAIPDGNPTGITHTITVNDSYTVSDVNVRVNVPHTWIGDLAVDLQHNGGPFVRIIDRMGVPATQFGCDANNLNVLLDDEAFAGSIESVCSDQFPGATPGNAASSGPAFVPAALFSAFNGQNAQGTWTLRVIDFATPDPGTLASWSLNIENAASGLCVPQGACCVGTTCTQTSQASCATSGGTWTAGQACYQSLTFTTNPNLPIPDGNPAGVSNTLNVGTAFSIHDLNLRLVMNHTWVGDLVVRLSHNGGPFVTVIDRPGVPASQFGCEGDNYNIVLDDEGVGGSIESLCGLPSNPQSPPNYTPSNPLSFFDGQNMAGTWTISISDFVTPDAGALLSWSLIAEDNDTNACADTDAIVDCITYTSPHPRILEVTVKVVDGANAPLAGANVTIHLTGSNGVDIVASGTTGAGGTILFTRRVTAACYTTDVTSVVLPGYTFDGMEPVNGYQKGFDTTPDADCRSASDVCGSG